MPSVITVGCGLGVVFQQPARAACREKHVRNYSKLLIDVLRGTLLSKSELQELEAPQVRANRFSYPQRRR